MTRPDLNDAIKSNSIDQVNDLLGHNSLLLCKMDRWGYLPIHYAVGTSLEMTKLLIHYKANVDVRSKHKHLPIYYAAKNNQLSTLNLLIKNSVFAGLDDLMKSFNIALEKRNTKVLQPIGEEFLKKNNEFGINHFSLEDSLVKAINNQYIEGIKILLGMKADPNVICDSLGNTALHVAATTNNKKLISELLNYGAQRNINNVLGKTYLDILSDINQPVNNCQHETWNVELVSEDSSLE